MAESSLVAGIFGVVIGMSLGIFGSGGSILAVPVLVYVLGQPVREAVPTSLLVVGTSALVGSVSHLRRGTVPWRSASLFVAASIGGSVAGARLSQGVHPEVLLGTFAVLMVAAAVVMVRPPRAVDPVVAANACQNAWRERPVLLVAVGFLVGGLTGVFGVGGGFILVPAWTLAVGCPVLFSVGASLFVITLNSAAALISHLQTAAIDPGVALPFALFAAIGALVGGRAANALDGARLSRWFACFVVVVALFVLIQVFVGDRRTLT